MKLTGIKAVFFSPTGNTERVALAVAGRLAQRLALPLEVLDCTLPQNRQEQHTYGAGDLVVFGTPVFASRVPNKFLPYVQSGFAGGGALAVPVVTYGNRSFDDGLMELRNELEGHGFHTIAGAAVVASHVFSTKMAPGRPDEADLKDIERFADAVAELAAGLTDIPAPIAVKGSDPVGPYYTPRGLDGQPVVILKVKPRTDPDKCIHCGLCAGVCPMGSIRTEEPMEVAGPCIKCQACVLKCPEGAKYFDDPAFLSHVAMLEQNFASRRAESEFFLP